MSPPRKRRGGADRGPRPVHESVEEVVAGLAAPHERADGMDRARTGAPSAALLGTVFSRWEELVGSAIARHTKPLRLEGGTLVVAVDQPAWATQVRLLAPGILTSVTERTGERLDRLEVVVRAPR